MWPLLALSILSLGTIIERLWFWFTVMSQEKALVDEILDTAYRDLSTAADVARGALNQPVGRYLSAPLRLNDPDPESFRLALEASADEELTSMRRGDKILEAVISISPLLGLLGTVLGLIKSLISIRIGDLASGSASGVTLGIGQALITTAAGLIIAILSLAFYRLFQALLFNQAQIFRRAGNELELLYRQLWSKRPPGYRPSPTPRKPIEPPQVGWLPAASDDNDPTIVQ